MPNAAQDAFAVNLVELVNPYTTPLRALVLRVALMRTPTAVYGQRQKSFLLAARAKLCGTLEKTGAYPGASVHLVTDTFCPVEMPPARGLLPYQMLTADRIRTGRMQAIRTATAIVRMSRFT